MTAILVLGLLSALRAPAQVPDSTYSSPAVRALVEAAAERYRQAGGDAVRLVSEVESEIGLLIRESDGEQVLTGVEQVWGRVTWSSDGTLVQSVVAYRSRLAGPALSTLTYMRGPWAMGPFVGDRVPLALAADAPRRRSPEEQPKAPPDPETGAVDASGRRRELPVLVNPLASDRSTFYRFSGGDTILTLRLPARTIPVVRVAVEPIVLESGEDDRTLLFRGEIHFDAVDHGVVRVRGEVVGRPRPRGVVTRVMRSALRGHFFFDVENALGDRGAWMPHRQWLELEVESPLSDESAVLRIVTDFSATIQDTALPPSTDMLERGARRALLVLATDSAGGPGGWRSELGSALAERDSRDLADLRARWTPARVRFGTRSVSQAVRYDRVEGLFTGGGLRAGGSAEVPGPFAALHGGWAWAEQTVRGGADLGLAGARWELGVQAERDLSSTDDFPRPFSTRPTILGVVGIDDLDYVDRYSAGLRASYQHRSGVSVRASVRAVRDRAPRLSVESAPLGGSFRPIRAISEGDYAHVGFAVAFREGRGGEFLAPGLSAGISWELARGDLAWQRVEGSVRARRELGRWSGAVEVFGGATEAVDPPPQALFEIGGYMGRLPGFPQDAFTGDRAAVGMVETAYTLPVLEAPIRIGSLFLPSAAPTPLVEVSAGWTGASRNATEVLSVHGWNPSDGVRATMFVGARLFGGFMRLGAARPLSDPGGWRFEIQAGGGS